MTNKCLKFNYARIIGGNLLTVIFVTFLLGCSSISNTYPDGDFKIVVLSDIHITNSESKDQRLKSLFADINKNNYNGVELVITCGDNVSSLYEFHYPDSSYKGYFRLQKFMDIAQSLEKPILMTMGNHEFKIDRDRDSDAPYDKAELNEMENIWRETTGFEPYYAREFKGWKIVVLNSMSERHLKKRFSPKQLDWFENELQNDSSTLIFFHHPIQTDNFRFWDNPLELTTSENEPLFFEIVEKHKNHIKGIFVGHGHEWVHDKLFEQIDVFETMSFGDDEESPFLVIGVDTTQNTIQVGRTPFE